MIEKNIPKYYIVVSEKAHAAEKYAAANIQKYVYKSTGVCYPLINDSISPLSNEILVGFSARNVGKTLEIPDIGNEGYVIKTVKNGVVIGGNTPRGTLYGAFAFLRKTVGFECYTKDVEKVDTVTDFTVPELDIAEKPEFEYRDAFFRNAFDEEFCVKNGLNTSSAYISERKGGSERFYTIGHTFNTLLPPDKYFNSHPEYFSLINGERQPDQPCLTNPEVYEIIKENLFKQIEENPECRIYSVAQNDVDVCCECPECKAINDREESASGTNVYFVNKLAKEVKKRFPNVLLHTFAYRFTRKAPKTLKPDDNVIVRLCNIECDWSEPFPSLVENGNESAIEFDKNLREWGKITKRLYVWDYAVNFHNYLLPFPCVYQMAENIKYYKERGVVGVFEQGNYTLGGGAALDDLKSYLTAKTLWNTETDIENTVTEFCDRVYGKGGKYIKEYIDIITAAVKGHRLTLYDKPSAPYLTDELAEKCNELFEKALWVAENKQVYERIEREKLSVDYMRIVRIEDEKERIRQTNAFAEKLAKYGINEISEMAALEDSLNFMRYSRFAEERFPRYDYLRF